MKRVTIKDVAATAGVSPATVSRVFSNESNVSPAIAAKVRAAAEKLEYRPNAMARSLIHARSDLIALVVGHLNNPFDAQLVEHLSKKLDAQGKRLLVVPADYGENAPAALVALDYQVDGIILAAGHLSKHASEKFVQLGVPVILYGREVHTQGVDCVIADNMSGAGQVGALFQRHGVKEAIFLRHTRDTFSDDERGRGFAEALGSEVTCHEIKSTADEARNAIVSALTKYPDVNGVFCANDLLAFGAVEAAVQCGKRVPEDLMIAGFDDIQMSASPFYDLTTVRQSAKEIATWIVERLIQRLDSPDLAVTIKRLPANLISRGTTPLTSAFGGLLKQAERDEND